MVVTLLWVGCSLASRRWLVRGRRAVWGEEQVFSFCTDNRWQMAGKLESFQTEEIFRGLCRWCLRSSRTLDSLAIIGRTWPFNRNQYSLNVSELNQQRESSLVNADSSSISSNPVKETVSVTEKCVLRCASCGQRCSSEEAVRIHLRDKHGLPKKYSDCDMLHFNFVSLATCYKAHKGIESESNSQNLWFIVWTKFRLVWCHRNFLSK